ncbi:MAG: hypothetical protein MJ152_00400 [Clostridia bacterium]|nr:hypothetical protein [Clostridia bacterium]
MKKKIFGFLSLLALAIGSLMFSMPVNINNSYAVDNEPIITESHYIMEDSDPEKITCDPTTNPVVAKTTGYDSYIIGTKNVVLTTTPEQGFKLVGWYIGTLGEGNFYNSDVFEEDGETIKYAINLEQFTFTIANVEENLKVNPVCEYIEYVADFSAFEPVVDGELPEMVTYHYNDVFDKTFTIKNNIDITEVLKNDEVYKNKYVTEETSSEVNILVDEHKRTTSVHFKYTVTEDTLMTLDYTKLYEATIKPYVKNPGEEEYALATGEEKEFLLSRITVTNIFDKLNEDVYLVKNSANNDNFIFKVGATNISNSIDSRTYSYYTLSQNTQEQQAFEVISSDFDVDVCYDSVPYTIDFTFALYENNFASIFNTGYQVEQTIIASRGTTHNITKSEVSDNYGYAFYGFAILTEEELKNGFTRDANIGIELSIDKNKPTNQHVYMLFTKVEYTIQLTGYNSIDLVYREITTHPINQAKLSFNRLGEEYSQVIEGTELSSSGTTSFNRYKIAITDSDVYLAPITNLGFNITKYQFIVNGTESEIFDLEDVILADGTVAHNVVLFKPEIFENYTYNSTISVKFVEEYEYYTITYYTKSAYDSTRERDVFMANIDATTEDEDAVITSSATATQRTITISNIKRYSKVTLKSVGELRTGSVYYNFVKFVTDDGSTTYYPEDAKLSQADITFMVEGAKNINVIYCVPSVHLSIETVRKDICDLEACSKEPYKLYLTQGEDPEELLVPEEGLALSWTIDLNDRSNIIKVYFDTKGVVKFGYSFSSFSLRQTDKTEEISGETKDEGSGVYSFKFAINTADTDGGLGYNFAINFAVTEFSVDVNKTIVPTEESSVEHFTIDIENPIIEFTMAEGLYVNYVAFGTSSQQYEGLEQNNDYKGNIFTCNFADILEELTSESNTINMYVDLVYHTYKVEVLFGLTNPKGETIDRRVTYPSMSLTYDSETSVVPEYAEGRVTFTGIEYGKDIEIEVGSIIQGLTAAGWFADDKGTVTPYSHGEDWLTIETLSSNKTLYYKLTYVNYAINLVVEDMVTADGTIIPSSTIAHPKASVNGVESSTISLFDYLVIDAGAVASNGFKLKSIEYQKSEEERGIYVPYLEYTFDESDWLHVYNKLYTKDENGNFVRNYSSQHLSGIQYYSITEPQYLDKSFNMSNYGLTDNALVFVLEYEYADIIFTSFNSGNNLVIDKTEGELTPDDFAWYQIKVIGSDGSVRELNYEDASVDNKITVLDAKIEITINFNKHIVDGKEYPLSYGIQLNRITMLGKDYGFVKSGEDGQQCKFSFNVDDIIAKITQDGTVQVNYTYIIIDKYVTITTNVTDSSFYAGGKFSFTITDSSGILESEGKTKLTAGSNFLAGIEFEFMNNWEDNFEIKSLKIYQAQTNINGYPILDTTESPKGDLKIDYSRLIPKSKYEEYGIYISGEVEKQFGMRLIDNVVIVLIVEPKLTFRNVRIEEETGDHYFEPTFKYEMQNIGGKDTLVSLSNKLTLGYDISAYEEIQNRLTFSYIDKNGQDIPSPTNAGTYEVIIGLKDVPSPTFTWLKEITLSYKIYLSIKPAKIHFDYDIPSKTFEKTYDGKETYNNVSEFMKYLRIRDNSNILNVKYTEQPVGSNFILASGIVAEITYTDSHGAQQATSTANEDKPTKYNITLSNVKLDSSSSFNKNFELERNEVVFEKLFTIKKAPISILGIVTKDKKWDGTDDVVVDLEDARLDDKAIIKKGDIKDDVKLAKGELKLKYEIADLENPYGEHNVIIANYSNLLEGSAKDNYYIVKYTKTAKIYRTSISVNIENVGTVTLFNNTNIVDLIPLDAVFVAEPILEDSTEYTKIYGDIAKYLTNNNTYAIGYKLAFEINGVRKAVDNQLTLSMPGVDKLTNVGWLSDRQAGTFNYQTQNGNIVVELSEQSNATDIVFVTKQRILLQLWQVLLIVGIALGIIGIIIAIVLIVRHNTIKKIKSRDVI